MKRAPGRGSIYLGDAIAHASERVLLARLAGQLERAGEPYVLLANCQFGGRQIDCIVATDRCVAVFEAKATRWPVRGEINGNWARRQPDGHFAPYTNAYLQALHAKNALRDAMCAGGPLGNWYPDAGVVFTTGIPLASDLTAGDRKVAVLGVDALDVAAFGSGSPWPLDRWHAFAAQHNLIPVSLEQAIAPPALQQAHALLASFGHAVQREHARDAKRWLAEDETEEASLLSTLRDGAGAFVFGPSGCGKTLVARRMAAELAADGATVLYLSARLYAGSWAALVRREIALLTDAAPASIYRAVRDSGAPVTILLDGLNELQGAEEALRGLRALASRLEARLIVTAQSDAPPQLSGLRRIAIARPSLSLKRKIAAAAGALGPAALEALNAVGSGFEAAVIGTIAGKVERWSTRQNLLDLFVREQLGGHARPGALGLRRLAVELHAALAFSIAESAFDELMVAQHVPEAACDAMFRSGLLARRAGRISFAHEMLQLACAAHGVGAAAARDPALWSALLDTPPYEDIAGDVLSTVEQPDVARSILARSTRAALLCRAATGRHGAIAQASAETLLDQAYRDCLAEIGGLTLLVVPGERATVNWKPDHLREWAPQERTRLQTVGADLHTERGVRRRMELCRAMDARLATEQARVFEEARAAGCFRLRNAAFELAYHGFGSETGFLQVCHAAQRNHLDPPEVVPDLGFDMRELSSGQLHFYLENRYALVPDTGRDAFAEQLIRCIEERFATEPYHVKQAILNAAGFARTASDEIHDRLVAAVQALEVPLGDLGTSSAVVDALRFLGAIEDPDDAYRRQIRSELAVATGAVATEKSRELALMLASAQFDHPYDHIYYEEIERLPEAARRTLYRRALEADTRYCGNLAWMVRQVVAWGDPADGPRMQQLARLPDPANPMPQEGWSAFVEAARFLGRHGIPLEAQVTENDAAHCLMLVRGLVHAAGEPEAGGARASALWAALEAMPVAVAIGVLGEVQRALLESHWSERVIPFEHLDLVAAYPRQCLFLARAFLDGGAQARYFHRVAFHEVGPQFAFHVIGAAGDRSDLERLRAQTLGRHARTALDTLKKLDLVIPD